MGIYIATLSEQGSESPSQYIDSTAGCFNTCPFFHMVSDLTNSLVYGLNYDGTGGVSLYKINAQLGFSKIKVPIGIGFSGLLFYKGNSLLIEFWYNNITTAFGYAIEAWNIANSSIEVLQNVTMPSWRMAHSILDSDDYVLYSIDQIFGGSPSLISWNLNTGIINVNSLLNPNQSLIGIFTAMGYSSKLKLLFALDTNYTLWTINPVNFLTMAILSPLPNWAQFNSIFDEENIIIDDLMGSLYFEVFDQNTGAPYLIKMDTNTYQMTQIPITSTSTINGSILSIGQIN